MNKLDNTFIRFVAVGIVNTVFGTTIMLLFYNVFHLNYWISSAGNYIFGSVLSYFLNKKFTFRNNEKSLRVVARFAANISACYLLAYGIARPVVRILLSSQIRSIQDNGALLVGMILFVCINYAGQKIYVFSG